MQKEKDEQLQEIEKKKSENYVYTRGDFAPERFLLKTTFTVFLFLWISIFYFNMFINSYTYKGNIVYHIIELIIITFTFLFLHRSYKNRYVRATIEVFFISFYGAVLYTVLVYVLDINLDILFSPTLFMLSTIELLSVFIYSWLLFPWLIIFLYQIAYQLFLKMQLCLQIKNKRKEQNYRQEEIIQIYKKREIRSSKLKETIAPVYFILKSINVLFLFYFLLFFYLSFFGAITQFLGVETTAMSPAMRADYKNALLTSSPADETTRYGIFEWVWLVSSLFLHKNRYIRIVITSLTFFLGVSYLFKVPFLEPALLCIAKMLGYPSTLIPIYYLLPLVATFFLYKLYFKLIPKAYHAIFKKKVSKFRIE